MNDGMIRMLVGMVADRASFKLSLGVALEFGPGVVKDFEPLLYNLGDLVQLGGTETLVTLTVYAESRFDLSGSIIQNGTWLDTLRINREPAIETLLSSIRESISRKRKGQERLYLVTRMMPQAIPGTGEISTYGDYEGLGLSASAEYISDLDLYEFRVKILYGVGVLPVEN